MIEITALCSELAAEALQTGSQLDVQFSVPVVLVPSSLLSAHSLQTCVQFLCIHRKLCVNLFPSDRPLTPNADHFAWHAGVWYYTSIKARCAHVCDEHACGFSQVGGLLSFVDGSWFVQNVKTFLGDALIIW